VKVYCGFEDPALKKRNRCIAIGIFDGVHRAHRAILRRVVREAKKKRQVAAVLTFDPHPRKVLSGDKKNPPILMSLDHRLGVIGTLGLDEAIVVRFDRKFSKMDRALFLEKLFGIGMTQLAVGHDFRFGHRALGNTEYLRDRSEKDGFRLFVFGPMLSGGKVISSSAIRRLIKQGLLKQAEAKLGRPVSVRGTVVRGLGRGKRIGYPTANLDPHHETLPPDGVYAVRGEFGGEKLKGVVHIGCRPTFGLKEKSVEAHFFGQKRDLYGREIELFFVKKLRPIRRFKDASALGKAIKRDIHKARRALEAVSL
jgi:riboflavin kinase / FMN adenylyltransferase